MFDPPFVLIKLHMDPHSNVSEKPVVQNYFRTAAILLSMASQGSVSLLLLENGIKWVMKCVFRFLYYVSRG